MLKVRSVGQGAAGRLRLRAAAPGQHRAVGLGDEEVAEQRSEHRLRPEKRVGCRRVECRFGRQQAGRALQRVLEVGDAHGHQASHAACLVERAVECDLLGAAPDLVEHQQHRHRHAGADEQHAHQRDAKLQRPGAARQPLQRCGDGVVQHGAA